MPVNNSIFQPAGQMGRSLFWIILILGCIPLSSHATFYYADATNGHDTADGNSVGTAWQTMAKVNSSVFLPGDIIYFKCGEEWREQLTMPSSGAAGNPITFSSYGAGAKPIINGAQIVSGWSVYSGNIYQTTVTTAVTQVFVDGAYYDPAHYPANGSYLKIDSAPDLASIADNDLPLSAGDLVGATIWLRYVPWTLADKTITSYDAGTHTIHWSGNLSYPIQANNGYFLTNQLWMLSAPRGWYYDPVSKQLYLWTATGDNPGSHVVEASVRNYGIQLNGKNYLTLQNLAVKYSQASGIYSYGSTGVSVNNSEVNYAGTEGMSFQNLQSGTISNNLVNFSLSWGILLIGANQVDCFANSVNSTGLQGSLPQSCHAGIGVHSCNNTTVRLNTVAYSAYDGFHLNFGNCQNNIIQNNVTGQTCLTLDDGAGIYVNGAGGTNNQVVGNIIMDSIGSTNGIAYTFTEAEGIYLDMETTGVLIQDNTIINTDRGIFVHDSPDNIIANNTVFRSRSYAFLLQEDNSYSGSIHGNQVTGNIWLSHAANAPSANFAGYKGNVAFGQYDYNYYHHFYYPNPIAQLVTSTQTEYQLASWQTAMSQDLHSKDLCDIYHIGSYQVVSVDGANLIANPDFNTDFAGWSKWPAAVVLTWTASHGLDTGCLHVFCNIAGNQPLAYSNAFAITAGKTYRITFSALASQADTINVILQRGGGAYEVVGSRIFNVGTARGEYSFLVNSTLTMANARLYFSSGDTDTDYYLDNVAVQEVTVSYPNPADTDPVLFYNPSQIPLSIPLAMNYIDVNNQAVSGTLVLAPFTSKVLFKSFNNNDGSCNNWESHDSAPLECSLGEYGEFCLVTATPSATKTPSATITFSPTKTPVVSTTPTATITPSATITPLVSTVPTAVITFSVTATPSATITPSATASLSMTITAALGRTGLKVNQGELRFYPNPARNKITFVINTSHAGKMQIKIFNILGNKIASLEDTLDASDGAALVWNCDDVAPGVYFAKVSFSDITGFTVNYPIEKLAICH